MDKSVEGGWSRLKAVENSKIQIYKVNDKKKRFSPLSSIMGPCCFGASRQRKCLLLLKSEDQLSLANHATEVSEPEGTTTQQSENKRGAWSQHGI